MSITYEYLRTLPSHLWPEGLGFPIFGSEVWLPNSLALSDGQALSNGGTGDGRCAKINLPQKGEATQECIVWEAVTLKRRGLADLGDAFLRRHPFWVMADGRSSLLTSA